MSRGAHGAPFHLQLANQSPLSAERHTGLAWRPPSGRPAVSAAQEFIPLALHEAEAFALRGPLVFQRRGNRLRPGLPLSLFGASGGPYLDANGAWALSLLPEALIGSPLSVVPASGASIVLVDEDRLDPLADGLIPLFEADSTLTSRTQAEVSRLSRSAQGQVAAQKAATALGAAGVLRAWAASDERLYVPDRKRLSELEDAAVVELHRAGALGLAHLSLASLATVALAETQRRSEAPLEDTFLSALREAM